jgi:hypothetical protein
VVFFPLGREVLDVGMMFLEDGGLSDTLSGRAFRALFRV